MTTSVSSTLPTTQALPTANASSAEATTTSKSSPEATLASIADALMGLTSSTIQRPQPHNRMFGRIERLVDSIARLIDAFANFKSGDMQQPSLSEPSTISGNAPFAPASDQLATPTTTPATPSQPSDEAPAVPTIEITPSVDTEQSASVAAENSPSEVTSKSSPFDLGTLLGKTGGFLWKPTSDKNGDLVVLLPKRLTGKVQEVRVLSPDGKKSLAKGKYSGVGNGDREHFRFSKPGSGYPDGSIVYIKLEDGTTRHVKISDTSRRIER